MTTPTYKYPNAIIYGIQCFKTQELDIGSTVHTLAERMSMHQTGVTQHNKWVANGSVGKRPDGSHCCSIQIMNRNYYTVFEIETCACNTKTELFLREGDIQLHYKKEVGALCINMCIAGATARAGGKVEYAKQYAKQYNKENAETIRKRRKQYNKENAETIRKRQNQYNIDNAKTIREYYQKNATKIAARQNVKHDCSVCGGRYTHQNKIQHTITQKHQRAMCIDSQAVTHHES